jgi:hypothetical protein
MHIMFPQLRPGIQRCGSAKRIYVYVMEAGDFYQSRKMLLMK